MGNYNADIIRGKWSNASLAYTEPDSSYSHKFKGNTEQYYKAMETNKSLYDNGTPYTDMQFIDPSYSVADMDFAIQQKQFQALHESILNTKKTGVKTKLIALDLETLRMNNVYNPNEYAAITELGITETIVGKRSINETSYSIALGIDKPQLTQYLKDIKEIKENGYVGKSYDEIQMLQSTNERLSRYSGKIDDVFQMEKVTNIGNVVTIKSLAESQKYNIKAIEQGLVNMSVLGGISEQDYMDALGQAGFNDVNKNYYSSVVSDFNASDLKPQTLDTYITKNIKLKDKIDNFFKKAKRSPNAFLIGFNTNSFDIPIYKAKIGDGFTKENSIDVYTGLQAVSKNKDIEMTTKMAKERGFETLGMNRKASQEGVARILGIDFEDSAHNAASDTKVTNHVLLDENFYNGKSLLELASETNHTVSVIRPTEDTVLYALNSIDFDKNGSDYLNSNRFNVSGINRGRYYKLGEVRNYEDGRIGVQFNSAADNTSDTFIKIFDSIEQMQEKMRKTFLFDNNVSQEAINKNDFIANADKARRNYENLYSVKSINYDIKKETYDGGFEKLNQYYKAYNISAEKIADINEDTIQDIAETTKYDDTLLSALRESFDTPEDVDIAKSTLRDFKAMYGRLQDESNLIGYIADSLEGKDLTNYQKTVAGERIRESLIDSVENVKDTSGINLFKKTSSKFYEDAARRDMFAVDINIAGSLTNVNFENRENATDSLVRSFYNKTESNNAYSVADAMLMSIDDLVENDILGMDFLENFYNTAGVNNTGIYNKLKQHYLDTGMTKGEVAKRISSFNVSTPSEIQPRKLADSIVSEIQTKYVQPIKEAGFTYDDFRKGYSSKLNDKYANFIQSKTEGFTGSNSLTNARGNRYSLLDTAKMVMSDGTSADFSSSESIGDIFTLLQKINKETVDGYTNKIISNVQNMSMTLDRKEVANQLLTNLNYSQESAEKIDRMLFLNRKVKGPFGLTTIPSEGSDKRTAFITQFAYSGEKGDDAFILANLNNDKESGLSNVMKTMGREDISFKEKIGIVRDNNYAAVFPLPAIENFEIKQDETKIVDELLNYFGDDGEKINYGLKTINYGDKGYKKIAQSHISMYDNKYSGDDSLKHLDLSLTDDADEINSAFTKTREGLVKISQDPTLNVTEKYDRMSRLFKKAQDRVITDMPGPSGYQTLYINGDFQKVFVPNLSDVMQSSHISIEPLEVLTLEIAKKDAMLGDTDMAAHLAKFSGNYNGSNLVGTIDKMISNLKSSGTISEEFSEYFLKHLSTLPMNKEKNFKTDMSHTFLSYIEDSMKKDSHEFSPKTQATVSWITKNKDRISQIIKEKATSDKKVSLLDVTMFNPYGAFDATIRPVNTQQPTAMKYDVKRVRSQLGEDTIKKLDIKLGFDALTTQRTILNNAFKDFTIEGGFKYSELEEGITVNVKQMDSAELINKFKDTEAKFDEIFEDLYKGAATKFGISEAESKYLLKEAFDITRRTSANTNEDRAIARASLVDNDLLTSPNIKSIGINPLTESQLKYARERDINLRMVQESGRIKTGTSFTLPGDEVRVYNGPSGRILDSVDDFLLNGNGHLIEDVQGISAFKGYLGNEKMTFYAPEFDSSSIYKNFKLQGKSDNLKEMFLYYSDIVFDKVIGENVSAATNMSIVKHGSGGIIYGNYLNHIFNRTHKEMEKDGSAFEELQNMFYQADKNGIRLEKIDGKITYDQTKMGVNGAHTQVEKLIETISNRAEDANDRFQPLWKSIMSDIDSSDKNQTIRVALTRGPNNESMGGATNLDPRMELILRSRFAEKFDELNANYSDFENFNAVINKQTGEKTRITDYVVNEIIKESYDGIKDTSITPIDRLTGAKHESAEKTVQGILLSTDYMTNPEMLQNSSMVLDVNLSDIVIASPGTNADELSKTSIYKIFDGEGVKYSDELKRLSKGKNLDDIVAIRVNLGDGIGFDDFKTNKGTVNQLIVPLYDITPFKGEVQYTSTIKDLNNALQIAKDYKKNGLDKSNADLNEAVQTLYQTLTKDIDYSNKKSYVSQKLLRKPMKNSGMLHAASTIVPSVNAIVDNYDDWLTDASYRKKIIDAVRTGDATYDIDIATSTLTGSQYTTTRNGKLYYDNVVELSKEGFKQKGFNFEETGKNIYYRNEDYRPRVETELYDKNFSRYELNDKMLDKIFNTDEALDMLENRKVYDYYTDALGNKKKTKELRKVYEENFTTEVQDTKQGRLLAKEKIINLNNDIKKINKGFEEISEKYLTEVGTFGLVGRYPTFMEGSTNHAKFKLNDSLLRDEMNVTAAIGNMLNMDHDGDKGFIKLFVGKKGETLSNKSTLKKALTKLYEMEVFTNENNEIMADILEGISNKILKTGSAVDKVSDYFGGNVDFKRGNIEKYMQKESKDAIHSDLNLSNLIDVDISEWGKEDVKKVFKEWDSKFGNMRKNVEMIAAATKAKATKSQIGFVSNINYLLNQALYESMTDALYSGDTSRKAALNEVKKNLHISNQGLLPSTEQKAIDVKHVTHGLSTSETSKYLHGVNKLFDPKGNSEDGLTLIREAMSGKIDEKTLDEQLGYLVKLSEDKVANKYFNSYAPKSITSLKKAIDFNSKLNDFISYADAHGISGNTAFGGVYKTAKELSNAFNMGYYYNNTLQDIAQDSIFVSTEDGTPILYKATNNLKRNGDKFTLSFDKFDLNNGEKIKTKAGYQPVFLKAEPIEGTATEMQSLLQQKFGNFRKYSIAEISDIKSFTTSIKKEMSNINVKNYANLYARGDTEAATKILTNLEGDTSHLGKDTIKRIGYYKEAVSQNDYSDFINKVEFIKKNTSYQKNQKMFADSPSFVDDLLTDINAEIIKKGKNAKSSTSNIFDNKLLELANDAGLSKLKDTNSEFQNFVLNREKSKNPFKTYEADINDIRKAQESFSPFSELRNEVNFLIEKYRNENMKTITSIQTQVGDIISTTSDIDNVFGWNGGLSTMRVGVNTENGLYGRQFKHLSSEDVDEILNYANRGKDTFSEYAFDKTKSNLKQFIDKVGINKIDELPGALDSDIIALGQKLNEDTMKKGAKATTEGLNKKAKKLAAEQADGLLKKTLEGAKDFSKTLPGKAVLALAALGFVGNVLSDNHSESPLAPEVTKKEVTGPTNNNHNPKAPASPKRKMIYTDASSGVHYKMSATSKDKISQMQTAQQIASKTNGSTNVNVYDDRSQVSNNWLERKFSELV